VQISSALEMLASRHTVAIVDSVWTYQARFKWGYSLCKWWVSNCRV